MFIKQNIGISDENKKEGDEMQEIIALMINLKRSCDRRERTYELLKDYPWINCRLMEAVDGQEISDEEIDKRFDMKRSLQWTCKNLVHGEVGATLSHRMCYELLSEDESRNYYMVIEDDVGFIGNLKEAVDKSIELLDSDMPCIITFMPEYFRFPFLRHRFFFKVMGGWASTCYMINKSAARIILRRRPYWTADDWYLFRKMGIKIYGLKNPVAYQRDEETTVFKNYRRAEEGVRKISALRSAVVWKAYMLMKLVGLYVEDIVVFK